MTGIAAALVGQGLNAEAENLFREVFSVQKRVLGAEHPAALQTMTNLANAIDAQGRYAEGEKLQRECLEIRRRVLGRRHPDTITSMNNLAFAIDSQGRNIEAARLYGAALELTHSTADLNLPGIKTTRLLVENMANLSWELSTTGNIEDRNPEESLRLAEMLIEYDPSKANHWDKLGVALYRNGRFGKATEALEKARQMRDGNDRHHQLFLAMAYWQADRHVDAVENYVQAAKWLANGKRAAAQYRLRDEAQSLFLNSSEAMELVIKEVSDEVNQHPGSRELLAVRAHLYAAQQAWDEAAEDAALVIDLTDASRTWPSPRQEVCREIAAWPEVFERVAQLRADEPAVWIGRGQYHLLRGRWSDAASDYARSAPTQPIADQTYQYAGLLLLAGDKEAYRDFCSELAALSGEPHDAFSAFVIARSCAIGAQSNLEARRIVEWAEQGVTESKAAWELHVLGLAQYRAGHLDEAIQSLEASNAGNWPALAKAQNDIVLAMAHHGRGDQEEAKQLLRQVETAIDRARPQQVDNPVEVAVPDWIGIEVLRREAEAIIEHLGD